MDNYNTRQPRNRTNSVAFTGYRPTKLAAALGDYKDSSIVEAIKTGVISFYERGMSYFLCGMAEGFDLLAAKAVMELRATGDYPAMELVATLPYPEFANTFSDTYRRLYDEVINMSSELVTICDSYSYGCYDMRNDYLVDNSEVLICCYDGQSGGTAYTYRRARKAGLTIYNIMKPTLMF